MIFKKEHMILCAAAAFFCILIVFFCRIIVVNQRYPQRKELNIERGNFYEIKPDVEMSVISAKWMDSNDLEREYGDVWVLENPEDYKGVDIQIKFKNKSNVKKKLQLYKLYIESESYDWNGCVAEFFIKKNKDSLKCELEPGKEAEYTISYTFLKENYKESDWKNLSQKGYYLVNKRYPLKVKWRI